LKKIMFVAGARPNFMKVAPIVSALDGKVDGQILLTGQHHAFEMADAFVMDLKIDCKRLHRLAPPARVLSSNALMSEIMRGVEPMVDGFDPDVVVVVGDVNSTLAATVVAKHKQKTVAHVEAGLRSWDRTMPEEINRVAVDHMCDWWFCSEASGVHNLQQEGISNDRVRLVGNVMIDSMLRQLEVLQVSKGIRELSVDPPFVYLTLHRPSNVDDAATLSGLLSTIGDVAKNWPVVFPIHPRTKASIERHGLSLPHNVFDFPPLRYDDALYLMKHACLIMTDSGGVQEEAVVLGVPCVTLRENTERPATVHCGGNIVAGTERESVLDAVRDALTCDRESALVPELWDGKAAERIAKILEEEV
jgi:UDP-N-acetylglucosamine 2-epimerase (non-hydrolysing)